MASIYPANTGGKKGNGGGVLAWGILKISFSLLLGKLAIANKSVQLALHDSNIHHGLTALFGHTQKLV